MKFYIAGRFERKKELQRYKRELEEFGHEVSSRWLVVKEQRVFESGAGDEAAIALMASRDLVDILSSDAVLHFLEDCTVGYTSGGRHVEFGVVLGVNIVFQTTGILPLLNIIIGPKRENIFHALKHEHFASWNDFLAAVKKGKYK